MQIILKQKTTKEQNKRALERYFCGMLKSFLKLKSKRYPQSHLAMPVHPTFLGGIKTEMLNLWCDDTFTLYLGWFLEHRKTLLSQHQQRWEAKVGASGTGIIWTQSRKAESYATTSKKEDVQTLSTATTTGSKWLLLASAAVLCFELLLSSKDWVVWPFRSSARALLYTAVRLCLTRPLASSPMQKYSIGLTQLLK